MTDSSGAPRQERTQDELREAFNLVADPADWKNPVDAVIPGDTDRSLIIDAVIHFTASVPVFETLPDGRLRVAAAGYYLTIVT